MYKRQVYECGTGRSLFDWAPTSSSKDYVQSAKQMIDWLDQHEIKKIYPGHYDIMKPKQVRKLLNEYIEYKE